MYDWTRSASETNDGITMDLLGFWSRIGKVHEFPIEHTGSVVPVHRCCTPRKGGNLFAQASRQVDGFRTRRSLNFKLPGGSIPRTSPNRSWECLSPGQRIQEAGL